MPTYREKPVEAFQLTEKSMEKEKSWPDWVQESWNKEADEDNSFTRTGGGLLTLKTSSVMHLLDIGWWIIKGLDGNFKAVSDEKFQEYYEPVGKKVAEKKDPGQDSKEPKEEIKSADEKPPTKPRAKKAASTKAKQPTKA